MWCDIDRQSVKHAYIYMYAMRCWRSQRFNLDIGQNIREFTFTPVDHRVSTYIIYIQWWCDEEVCVISVAALSILLCFAVLDIKYIHRIICREYSYSARTWYNSKHILCVYVWFRNQIQASPKRCVYVWCITSSIHAYLLPDGWWRHIPSHSCNPIANTNTNTPPPPNTKHVLLLLW